MLSPELTPPIRTTADLHLHWRRLMGPLGFTDRTLWICMFDADDRVSPVLPQITDLPPAAPASIGPFVEALGIKGLPEVRSYAFLLSRPGGAYVTAADRTWAAAITQAARHHEFVVRQTFLACDETIRPLHAPCARTSDAA